MTTWMPNINLVDLMIPKTGTSWRMQLYERHGFSFGAMNSGRGNDGKHDVPDAGELSGKTVVTFVRHPVTWLQSRYYMGAYGGDFCPLNVLFRDAVGSPNGFPFERFVDQYLERMPGVIGEWTSQYTDLAQFIGRYERIRHDMAVVFGFAGIPFNRRLVMAMPTVNITDYSSLRHDRTTPAIYRDEAQWQAVCDAEADLVAEYYS